MTPAQRSLQNRIAAYIGVAGRDARQMNAVARSTYRDGFRLGHECRLCPRFEMPAGLTEAETQRRADALRRVHFGRLALASSLIRSAKKGRPERDSGRPKRHDGTRHADRTADAA